MDEVQSGALAPAEPVATPPAADAVPAPVAPTDQENAEGQQTDESVKPQPKYTDDDLSKKINERLSKERRRLERSIRAEMERDFYKQQLETRDQPKAQQPQGKPRLEDFQGRPYDEYIDALTDWKLEQRMKGFSEQTQQERQAMQEQQRIAEQSRFVQQKLAPGLQKYSDFEEVALAEDVPNTPIMALAISRLDNAPDVAYHLGLHHDEAMKIANLPEVEQAWAIKELSQKLAAPPKPTQAPPPIVPNASKASVEKRLEDADYDEFVKIRRKQIAAKKGR